MGRVSNAIAPVSPVLHRSPGTAACLPPFPCQGDVEELGERDTELAVATSVLR